MTNKIPIRKSPLERQSVRNRTRDLRGTRTESRPRVASIKSYAERTICPDCGAFYAHRVWRFPVAISIAGPQGIAAEARCPACSQVSAVRGFGEVEVRGSISPALETAIRQRTRNVARRAAFTQPERRLVEIRRDDSGMTIVATSQKLAHRITHELQKAFGGHATYSWSDRDGGLRSRWDVEAERAVVRRPT
jgi:NMD protein affecting ribosome stability and mRNA decay